MYCNCIRATKQCEKNELSRSMTQMTDSHYSELKQSPCLPEGKLLSVNTCHCVSSVDLHSIIIPLKNRNHSNLADSISSTQQIRLCRNSMVYVTNDHLKEQLLIQSVFNTTYNEISMFY